MKYDGELKPVKSQSIFIREVTLRYDSHRVEKKTIKTADDIITFLRTVTYDNTKEHFFTVFLNGAHQIIGFQKVTTGLANMCQCHPREVFQPAIIVGAISVILAHNHPSQELDPSTADFDMTKRLKEAGSILGIKVLDHLIFNDTSYINIST